MLMTNNYSDAFEDFAIKNGRDIFTIYNDINTTDEERERLVEWLFNLIRSRDNAVPLHVWSDDIFNKIVSSLCDIDTNVTYQDGAYSLNNIGANILTQFFPEILDVVKSGKASPRDFFKDDKRLLGYCRTVLKYCTSPLEMFKMMSFRGSSRCYNFRPATAKALYELYGKDNCKVLDTSSGFGGRLLGFFTAKKTAEYVGIDPNTADSCNKFILYMSRYFTNKKAYVNKIGSEDFTIESYPQYENYFDISFTSPPYFNIERYSDDITQSHVKFNTYDLWIDGFYRNTIYNSCNSLKLDGVFAVNISWVDNIKEYTEEFLNDCGFYIIKEDKYLLRIHPRESSYGSDKMSKYEPIWVAKHYTELLKDGMITRDKAEECYQRVKFGNKRVL
nr:MAG TPA: putative modification methylase [Bacteriophage sp.]